MLLTQETMTERTLRAHEVLRKPGTPGSLEGILTAPGNTGASVRSTGFFPSLISHAAPTLQASLPGELSLFSLISTSAITCRKPRAVTGFHLSVQQHMQCLNFVTARGRRHRRNNLILYQLFALAKTRAFEWQLYNSSRQPLSPTATSLPWEEHPNPWRASRGCQEKPSKGLKSKGWGRFNPFSTQELPKHS